MRVEVFSRWPLYNIDKSTLGRLRKMFVKCLAESYEIFLIFRSIPSNFGTWMSRKARSEPGRRIAGGCVRIHDFSGIFRKSIWRSQARANILRNLPSRFMKYTFSNSFHPQLIKETIANPNPICDNINQRNALRKLHRQ